MPSHILNGNYKLNRMATKNRSNGFSIAMDLDVWFRKKRRMFRFIWLKHFVVISNPFLKKLLFNISEVVVVEERIHG